MKPGEYCSSREYRGFSLVELAIVLVIVGVLAKAIVEPVGKVQHHKNRRLTTTELALIQERVLAHVIAQGVLPCPVLMNHSQSSSAVLVSARALRQREQSIDPFRAISSLATDSGHLCNQGEGGVPALVLGMNGSVNQDGALLDVWGRPYRYIVSLASHAEKGIPKLPDWTSEGEVTRVGIAHLRADLTICADSAKAVCPQRNVRANDVAFVVLSSGADDSSVGVQAENQDADKVFVLQSDSVDPIAPYDDQLVWVTGSEIVYWLLRAGWLP